MPPGQRLVPRCEHPDASGFEAGSAHISLGWPLGRYRASTATTELEERIPIGSAARVFLRS